MSNLTAKQEAFAQAYVGGMNASDAYRSAYDAGDMKSETINRKAKELMDNGKITARVQELKDAIEPEIQERLKLTKETAIERLMKISELAVNARQYAAGSGSLMNAAKIAGLVIDKVDARVEMSESQAKVKALDLYENRTESE